MLKGIIILVKSPLPFNLQLYFWLYASHDPRGGSQRGSKKSSFRRWTEGRYAWLVRRLGGRRFWIVQGGQVSYNFVSYKNILHSFKRNELWGSNVTTCFTVSIVSQSSRLKLQFCNCEHFHKYTFTHVPRVPLNGKFFTTTIKKKKKSKPIKNVATKCLGRYLRVTVHYRKQNSFSLTRSRIPEGKRNRKERFASVGW